MPSAPFHLLENKTLLYSPLRCSVLMELKIAFAIGAITTVVFAWSAEALAQFTQSGLKLVGSGAVGTAEEGYRVALSADGNTAIIGAPGDGTGGIGAAWVFTRNGRSWTQQGNKMVGNGAVGIGNQGTSVALSADGNTAIVGGDRDNSNVGAAWVYTRTGGVWTQQGNKLVGTNPVGTAQQGISVALSADGNTAAVGGPYDNSDVGAVWVFTRSGGVWTQQAKLIGTGAVGSAIFQGWSVALSADGNTLIVGGYGDNTSIGAAWVFTRSGGTWTQQGNKLVGSGAVGSPIDQGVSVALSADGNTAIIGGILDNSNTGAAWVFTRSGGVWNQQGNKLVGTGASGKAFQGAVALSPDGNTAVVAGSGDGSNTGAVWVFTRTAGVWTQQGSKLVGTGAVGQAQQGSGVAVSCNTVAVGGFGDNNFTGALWIFAAWPPSHDVNGDCMSDILWYNTSSGQTLAWLVNATSVVGGGSIGSASSPWAIGGQRDFNGDGFSDLLWHNASTGQTVVWFLNGTSIIGGGSLGSVVSPWTVAGTGDFNGDGFADVLWYSSTSGQAVIWLLKGTSVIGGGSPGSAGSPWTIAGTGDFNGDAMTDILWYNNSTGQAVIWLMNGTSVTGGGSPGSVASPWAVVGTGDFNGDGKSDILWRNGTSGQLVIWLINGTTTASGGSPGSVANPWIVAQTGDFNGDLKSDILWVNPNTGQLVAWLLNSATVVGGGSLGSAASPWQVQGVNAD
jgi:hypothetical protein